MKSTFSSKDKRVLLDVGNTSVTYGIYQGGKLKRFGADLCDNIPKIVKINASSGRNTQFHLVISSVVPKNTRFLRKKCPKSRV